MQFRNTVATLVASVVAMAALAIGIAGFLMMWDVVQHDNIDSGLFMSAHALMMFSAACFMLIERILRKTMQNTKKEVEVVVHCIKKTIQATKKSLVYKMRKIVVFKKKEIGQQA